MMYIVYVAVTLVPIKYQKLKLKHDDDDEGKEEVEITMMFIVHVAETLLVQLW